MEHGSSECVVYKLGALGWSRISRGPSEPEERCWVRQADTANAIDAIRAHPAHDLTRQLKLVHHAHVLGKHALAGALIRRRRRRARLLLFLLLLTVFIRLHLLHQLARPDKAHACAFAWYDAAFKAAPVTEHVLLEEMLGHVLARVCGLDEAKSSPSIPSDECTAPPGHLPRSEEPHLPSTRALSSFGSIAREMVLAFAPVWRGGCTVYSLWGW